MIWTGVSWSGLLALSYLIGCFNSAYMLGRLMRGRDIRRLGDGNAGAANAYRELGPKVGIAVWAAEAGKGAAAVALIGALAGSTAAQMLAGIAVVAGHNWPFFLQLRGGRGASTAMGVLVFLMPLAVVPLSVLSLVPLAITRSATVALSFIFVPLSLVAWYTGAPAPLIGYSIAVPVMVGLSHWASVKLPPLACSDELTPHTQEADTP